MSAFSAGKVLGAFLGSVLIGAVITFVIRRLRSSTAVGLGAAGWIVTMVVRTEDDGAVTVGAFAAAMLCALLAVALGARERGRAIAHGHPTPSDATGAIALGGILRAVGGAGLVVGVLRDRQSPPAASASSSRAAAPAKPPERLAFDQANFAYSVPADFLKVDVPADGPEVSLSVGSLERPHVSVQVRSWIAPGTTLAELAAAEKKARSTPIPPPPSSSRSPSPFETSPVGPCAWTARATKERRSRT